MLVWQAMDRRFALIRISRPEQAGSNEHPHKHRQKAAVPRANFFPLSA
jgi:hypothetical protein